MDYTDILYAVEDSTAIITINRPSAKNSVNGEVSRGLAAAMDRLDADAGPDIEGAVHIIGSG